MSRSFKSYIEKEVEEHELQNLEIKKETPAEKTPRLLSGELIIAEASDVLLFERLKEWKSGISGTLVVTNFKLSFLTTKPASRESTGCQQSFLLDETDVSLSNIDAVYLVSKGKKRKLPPGDNVSSKVKGLQVVCKTMQILTFSFKNLSTNSGKTVTNSLLHHAFPRRHQLLFAYDYREPSYHCNNEVRLFQDRENWTSELKRTQCQGWRVSLVNQHYQLSPNLPAFVVVPESVLDGQLVDASRHFRGARPPVWCWGTADGAALVRMADILPTISNRVQENVMLEQVRKSHPKRRQPHILEMQDTLPTRDIQQSYLKLRELCAPDTAHQFQAQESNFWSLLDSSRWLYNVSSCLSCAVDCCKLIVDGATVVLQEGEGRDLSAVVSSLVQLLCDPFSRSIVGFQSLIQKEWIALGHPFCSRLGHVTGSETEQSPVFLLFLDCVWQLANQFPSEFEFTETYLTTLWDSSHIGVFDTFLFDCERDRKCAVMDHHHPLPLRSVWDWEEQFNVQDIALFRNPLYSLLPSLNKTFLQVSQLSLNIKMLPVKCGIPNLELWLQCYCRWLPVLEVVGGGKPQVDFQTRLLVDDLTLLQRRALAVRHNPHNVFRLSVIPFNFSDELSFTCDIAQLRERLQCNPNSFFPFTHHGACSTEFLLNSSFIEEEGEPGSDAMIDSQSSLNVTD